MIDLARTIETIERHLADNTAQSLTYAALECRLAIERICYERLRVTHDYISYDDLLRWQPAHVIKTLSEEVDPHVADTYSFSIGLEASDPDEPDKPVEYVELGKHFGFNIKRLEKLWNALSRIALHAQLPKVKDQEIPPYGDPELIHRKVNEALEEIRQVARGTLIMSGIGEEISFECKCGTKNKRRARLLKGGQVINCINPACLETWKYVNLDADRSFERMTISFGCECGKFLYFPQKQLTSLPTDKSVRAKCECGREITVGWALGYYRPATSEDAAT